LTGAVAASTAAEPAADSAADNQDSGGSQIQVILPRVNGKAPLIVGLALVILGLGFVLLYPWLRRRPALVATWFGKVNTMAGAVTLGLSAILVLAGGPVQQVDLGLGALLAVTAIGHFVTLWRRTFRPPATAGS